MSESLSPTPPSRLMVVAAHPDDIEHTMGGTVAKWATQGTTVSYVLATSGEVGSHDLEMVPSRVGPLREAEQRTAAEILGVSEVVFLGYPDGTLFDTPDLRRDITREIRRFRPSAVAFGDPSRRYMGTEYFNHPDHIAGGAAALAAVMPCADSPHIFPELVKQGWQPHKAYEIYLYWSDQPNVWVDISDTIEIKIRALRAHADQVKGWNDLDKDVRASAKRVGSTVGLEHAEAFRYFKTD